MIGAFLERLLGIRFVRARLGQIECGLESIEAKLDALRRLAANAAADGSAGGKILAAEIAGARADLLRVRAVLETPRPGTAPDWGGRDAALDPASPPPEYAGQPWTADVDWTRVQR